MVYTSILKKNQLLPEEQKGCRRRTRGTKDQLLIDKALLMDCKRRHTHMAVVWFDYKKAYEMVAYSRIVFLPIKELQHRLKRRHREHGTT